MTYIYAYYIIIIEKGEKNMEFYNNEVLRYLALKLLSRYGENATISVKEIIEIIKDLDEEF